MFFNSTQIQNLFRDFGVITVIFSEFVGIILRVINLMKWFSEINVINIFAMSSIKSHNVVTVNARMERAF